MRAQRFAFRPVSGGVEIGVAVQAIGFGVKKFRLAGLADAGDQEENRDSVSWILNQDFQGLDAGTLDDGDLGTPGSTGTNYSFTEVQDAIWFFTDGSAVDASTASGANTQEIIDLATTAGEGFVAGEGDLVAVLFAPLEADRQTYLVGVGYAAQEEE